jgi:hypothetical protein
MFPIRTVGLLAGNAIFEGNELSPAPPAYTLATLMKNRAMTVRITAPPIATRML